LNNQFRNNPTLIDNIPDLNLNLTMSFTVGSGIESITGSCFKIDISYLSPYINYAKNLENIAQNHDVNLVVSEDFTKYVSKNTKEYLRPIESIIINNKSTGNLLSFQYKLFTLLIWIYHHFNPQKIK